MTTIAISEGILAVDSQGTMGNLISFNDFDKVARYNSDVFGDVFVAFAGAVNHISEAQKYLMEIFSGNIPEGIKFDFDQMTLVMLDEDGDAYEAMLTEASTDISWLRVEQPYATGSGAHFAYGALHSGATAEQAVMVAAGLDCFTNDNIKCYNSSDLTIKNKLLARKAEIEDQLKVLEEMEIDEDQGDGTDDDTVDATADVPDFDASDDDGWIDNPGTEDARSTPEGLASDELVVVRFRNGNIENQPMPAFVWDWTLDNDEADILEYKIVEKSE